MAHVACAADVQPLGLHDVLWLADAASRRLWDELALGVGHADGHPELRELIADGYEQVRPDDVIVTAGAAEALGLLARASVRSGDHAVVTGPCPAALPGLVEERGADVTVLGLRHTEGWQLRASTFSASLSPRTRLAVLGFPHDPTGALPDAASFTAILRTAGEHRIRVVVDELMRGLERDPEDRLPAAADLDERAVSIGGLGGGYGLAGLRIGWIATRDSDLRERLATLRGMSATGVPGPSEILAIIALRNREELTRRACDLIGQGFAAWHGFIERWSDAFEWVPPRAGTVALPRLVRGVPIERFCDELLHETGVALLPGTHLGAGDGHFRIGLGRRDVPVAVEKLDAFARRWLSAY